MTGISLHPDGFIMELVAEERALLLDLAQQLDEVLSDEEDPARSRLTPEAYEADPEASAEFNRLVSEDIIALKRDAAGTLSAVLMAHEENAVITRAQALSCMRALGDLRLILAERMGITLATPEVHAEHESANLESLYDWLGYLQECFVLALTRSDIDAGYLEE